MDPHPFIAGCFADLEQKIHVGGSDLLHFGDRRLVVLNTTRWEGEWQEAEDYWRTQLTTLPWLPGGLNRRPGLDPFWALAYPDFDYAFDEYLFWFPERAAKKEPARGWMYKIMRNNPHWKRAVIVTRGLYALHQLGFCTYELPQAYIELPAPVKIPNRIGF